VLRSEPRNGGLLPLLNCSSRKSRSRLPAPQRGRQAGLQPAPIIWHPANATSESDVDIATLVEKKFDVHSLLRMKSSLIIKS